MSLGREKMVKPYDNDNIFSKIIDGKVESEIIFENSYVLCIKDLFPRAPVHILILPKKKYIDIYDFSLEATIEEKEQIFASFKFLIEKYALIESGNRIITNSGKDGRQEIPHLHFHLLAGKDIGKMTN